jgi:hypothetical protein
MLLFIAIMLILGFYIIAKTMFHENIKIDKIMKSFVIFILIALVLIIVQYV